MKIVVVALLAALTGLTHGRVCERPDLRALVTGLVDEGKAVAAAQGKFMRPVHAPNTPLNKITYALHFDASLFARYLRRYAEARGVERIEGKVRNVELGPEDASHAYIVIEREDGTARHFGKVLAIPAVAGLIERDVAGTFLFLTDGTDECRLLFAYTETGARGVDCGRRGDRGGRLRRRTAL